jgi:hypothetical protein
MKYWDAPMPEPATTMQKPPKKMAAVTSHRVRDAWTSRLVTTMTPLPIQTTVAIISLALDVWTPRHVTTTVQQQSTPLVDTPSSPIWTVLAAATQIQTATGYVMN